MFFKAHTDQRSHIWLAATSRWEHFDFFLTFFHVIPSINHNMTKRRTLLLDKDIRDRIDNLCTLVSFLFWALKPSLL